MKETSKINKVLIVLLIILLTSLIGTLTFFIGLNFGRAGNLRDTEISDSDNNYNTGSALTDEDQEVSNNEAVFEFDKFMLLEIDNVNAEKVYYLKDGDIWETDISNFANPQSTELIDEEHSPEFVVDRDQKYLAYTTFTFSPQVGSPGQPFLASGDGDTVIIKDLASGIEKKVFEKKDSKVSGLFFDEDSNKLYITGTKVWVYNIDNEQIDEYTVEGISDLCQNLSSAAINDSKSHLILSRGCYEGTESVVYNLTNQSISYSYGIAHIGGETAFDFIGDNKIISLSEEINEDHEFTILVRDLSGKKITELGSFDEGSPKRLFESQGNTYLAVLNNAEIKIYLINKENLNLSEVTSSFSDQVMLVRYAAENAEGVTKRYLALIKFGSGEEYILLEE